MKPREMKPEIVYRIIGPDGEAQLRDIFELADCDEYDFKSVEEARNANVHGEFQSSEYKIAKYRVTYELIESDSR